MRMLRYLLPIALVFAMCSVARAAGFQMVVVDPSYATNIITTTDFTFSFVPCVPGEPVGAAGTYLGCFAGINDTGAAITSLQMEIPVFGGLTAGCSLDGAGLDIFTNVTCGENAAGTEYILNYSGGNIPNAGPDVNPNFVIAEAGVDPGIFPVVSATINATPEPSSIWLLSTGILSIGFFFARRERVLAALRPSS